jgi:hypothetical protein
MRNQNLRPLLLCFCLLLIAGCSKSPHIKSTTHSGDISQFILTQFQRLGGHAKNTNALPQIATTWKTEVFTGGEYLEKGEEEIHIYLPDEQYQKVCETVIQICGPPPSNTLDGSLIYSRPAGIPLSVDHNGKTTRVIMDGKPQDNH